MSAKRRRTKVPSYRKHSSRNVGFVQLNGVRHYLPGAFGSQESKDEYDRLIQEYLAANRYLPPKFDKNELLVGELCIAYARHADSYYLKNGEPTNERKTIKRVLAVVRKLYGTHYVSDFGPLALKAVRQAFIDEGVSRPTANRYQRQIVRMFRWGASEELISARIVEALKTVDGLKRGRCDAKEPTPIRSVPMDTVQETLKHAPPILAAMIKMQLMTAMRPGEVCQLRPADIDRTGNVWTFTPASHKTEHHDKPRIVAIGPEAQRVLTPYLLRPADEFCFKPEEAEKKRLERLAESRKTPPQQGNRPGTNCRGIRKFCERYDTNSYRRAIHRVCDIAFAPTKEQKQQMSEAELAQWKSERRWSPNQLRHLRATEIRERFGLDGSQVVLGHSHAQVTQVYAELNMRRAAEIMAQIG